MTLLLLPIYQAHFHSSTVAERERRISCTMIPGDGVGPEMMDSVQDVLKAIGAPIDFEVHHLSEVKNLILKSRYTCKRR